MNRFQILKGIKPPPELPKKEWVPYFNPRNPYEVRVPKYSKWPGPLDTAEQLVAELNKEIAGEKDRHDYIIDHWIKLLKPNPALSES